MLRVSSLTVNTFAEAWKKSAVNCIPLAINHRDCAQRRIYLALATIGDRRPEIVLTFFRRSEDNPGFMKIGIVFRLIVAGALFGLIGLSPEVQAAK